MKKIKMFSMLILIELLLFIENVSAVEEFEVPNTLGASSSLLITIAMFDIALGIGAIIYVKKNRVEE